MMMSDTPKPSSWLYPYAPGRREKLEKCQMIVGAGSLPKTLDAVLDTYLQLYELRHYVIDNIEPKMLKGHLVSDDLYERWRKI